MSTINLERQPHVWGYGRGSTDKQKITLHDQRDRFHEYVRTRFPAGGGFVIGEPFFGDVAESSGIPWNERPKGRLLWSVVRPGDHIVIHHLNRPFRSIAEASDTLKKLLASNITLHILDMQLDLSTPNGRLLFHLLASVDEWVREMIRENTRNALDWKRRRGLPYNGRPPIGWKKVGEKHESRYVPNPHQRSGGYFVVECRDKHNIPWEVIPSLLRRKRWKRSDLQYAGGFPRKNPADEISVTAARNLYAAAKAGFPLANGGRKHCFDWEPGVWKSWGIAYDT
ncbi:MAG: recombinase family protein [Planctomycetes bacterium]|nr:recombinase family protein [Planctomycetota bacterium]